MKLMFGFNSFDSVLKHNSIGSDKAFLNAIKLSFSYLSINERLSLGKPLSLVQLLVYRCHSH